MYSVASIATSNCLSEYFNKLFVLVSTSSTSVTNYVNLTSVGVLEELVIVLSQK